MIVYVRLSQKHEPASQVYFSKYDGSCAYNIPMIPTWLD